MQHLMIQQIPSQKLESLDCYLLKLIKCRSYGKPLQALPKEAITGYMHKIKADSPKKLDVHYTFLVELQISPIH